MLAFRLDESKVKSFMGKLLKENIFCDFNIRSVDIVAKNRFSVDGEISGGEAKGFSAWSEIQPLIFEVVKLMGKPSHFKIVLSFKEPMSVHENASALFLNIMYENGVVNFTTATAQKAFTLERTLDSTWDEWMRRFFVSGGIIVNER